MFRHENISQDSEFQFPRNSPKVATHCFLKRSESNPSTDGRASICAVGQIMQMIKAVIVL